MLGIPGLHLGAGPCVPTKHSEESRCAAGGKTVQVHPRAGPNEEETLPTKTQGKTSQRGNSGCEGSEAVVQQVFKDQLGGESRGEKQPMRGAVGVFGTGPGGTRAKLSHSSQTPTAPPASSQSPSKRLCLLPASMTVLPGGSAHSVPATASSCPSCLPSPPPCGLWEKGQHRASPRTPASAHSEPLGLVRGMLGNL